MNGTNEPEVIADDIVPEGLSTEEKLAFIGDYNRRHQALEASLLEEVPTAESSAPYDVPDADALSELADAREVEEQVAQQIVTVRDEQALNVANLAQDGAAHFLVSQDGRELCGSCGRPFPCPSWLGEIEPRNLAASSGQPVPDEDKARVIAELLSIDIERARQMVLMSTPLDEIK